MARSRGIRAWSVFGELSVRGLGKSIGQLKAFDAAGSRASTMLSNVGRNARLLGGVLVGLGGVAAGVMASSIRRFASFDDAMTQSLAIMGDVSESMQSRMAQAARRMGRETRFSATQAAESFFFLASAGLDAEQSIAALPQVAAFAQAGMFDMARATDLATDAQSALGLTVRDPIRNLRNLTRVTDVLVKANTLANASVEQFATALTTDAGAALKAFGKDVEEGVAVLAALADQGIKAEKAGSGLARFVRLLSDAWIRNREEFRKMEIEIFDRGTGEMKNFADIVAELEGGLSGLSDEQRAMRLEQLGFQARVQQFILPLLGTSEAIRGYESDLRNAANTTQQVSRKQLTGFAAVMDRLKGSLEDVALRIGERLAPRIRGLAGALDSFLESGQVDSFVDSFVSGSLTALSGLGTVFEFLGRGINTVFSESPIIAQFGVLGFLLMGPRGAAVFGFIAAEMNRVFEQLAGPQTQEAVFQERIDDLEQQRLELITAMARIGGFPMGAGAVDVEGGQRLRQILLDLGRLEDAEDPIGQLRELLRRLGVEVGDTALDTKGLQVLWDEAGRALGEAGRDSRELTSRLADTDRQLEQSREILDSLPDSAREVAGATNVAGNAFIALGRGLKGLGGGAETLEDVNREARELAQAMRDILPLLDLPAERARRLAEEAATELAFQRDRLQREGGGRVAVDLETAPPAADNLREALERELKRAVEEGDLGRAQALLRSNLGNMLTEGIEGTEGQVVRAASGLGQQMVRGLVDGTFDLEDFFHSALTTFLNVAIQKMTQVLLIASPSRVTADMGRSLVQGLVVGVESESPSAAQATRALGLSAGQALEDALGMVERPLQARGVSLGETLSASMASGIQSGAPALHQAVMGAAPGPGGILGRLPLTPGGQPLGPVVTRLQQGLQAQRVDREPGDSGRTQLELRVVVDDRGAGRHRDPLTEAFRDQRTLRALREGNTQLRRLSTGTRRD